MNKLFIILLFLWGTNEIVLSQIIQDTTQLYSIETNDGNEYTGKIQSMDSLYIRFETTTIGTLSIPKNFVNNIELIKQDLMIKNEYWFNNPQAARYFWAPNGNSMKAGEVYYQNLWLFYNQFSFGVVDYFSVSAGIIPLFLLGGLPTPVWVVPKFSIPVVKNKFNLGIGALTGYFIGEDGFGFGILFGNATVGNRNNNLTLGLGYGFADGEFADQPIINLSGMVRTGPRGYFLSVSGK